MVDARFMLVSISLGHANRACVERALLETTIGEASCYADGPNRIKPISILDNVQLWRACCVAGDFRAVRNILDHMHDLIDTLWCKRLCSQKLDSRLCASIFTVSILFLTNIVQKSANLNDSAVSLASFVLVDALRQSPNLTIE
eukprot:TRINITY_DN4592_c0_g1_i2.p1 TRINITY_DN4592_c0_g1~~TRINITY_DN4592_c0_g1_i2.p1  ORF type:complete len:143 (+),score=17.06 TRINITY_DN4592_c0_g1_i2:462-890(+)